VQRELKDQPQINLIVAMTNDYVIGYSNRLPWKLSVDLKRFRKLTTSQSVIMGRKTYESIGRPLPKSQNIVVSRRRGLRIEGCLIANSLRAAISKASEEKRIFVIGGGELYREALPISERIYLTLIEIDTTHRQPFLFKPFPGDAHFPAVDRREWRLTRPGVRHIALPIGTKTASDRGATKNFPAIYFRFLTLIRRKRKISSLNVNSPGSEFDLSWVRTQEHGTQRTKRSPPAKKAVPNLSQRDLFK